MANTLITADLIARDVQFNFKRDAAVATYELPDRSFDVSVTWNGHSCRFKISLQERTWSLHDLMERIMQPHLNGLLDGNT